MTECEYCVASSKYFLVTGDNEVHVCGRHINEGLRDMLHESARVEVTKEDGQ